MTSNAALRNQRWVSLVCGVVAAVVALFTQWASRRPDFHPSLLLNVAESDAIADSIRGADPAFQFVAPSDHYDGVYFYAMARDPFAMGIEHDLIDLAAYRYGHPLYSWVAGLLSGGQAAWLPWVFWAMSVASMFAAAFLVSRLVRTLGGSPWWGLAVAASPGLLFSASTALTEPAQVALVCASLLLWMRSSRSLWLGIVLVAVCLTKEQLVLVPLALLVAPVFEWRRGTRIDWARLGALAAGPAALGGWLIFIRSRFTADQQSYDDGNVGWPLTGWLETFNMAGNLRSGGFEASQIGSTTPSGLIATAVVLGAATVVGVLRRDALAWVVIFQVGLISCLGWRTLLFPHEMFRIPSVALLLAVVLLAVGARRPAREREVLPNVSRAVRAHGT